MYRDRAMAINDRRLMLSCIVPVFNEEAVVEQFIVQLQRTLQSVTDHYEIIIVDDGSTDTTVDKLLMLPRDCPIKLLALSRNFGKEVALTAGIEHCSGDVVILMDADFQHPLDMISVFLAKWSEGYDMVYGIRHDRVSESWLKRSFAGMFYWIMKKISKIDIPNNAGDFRLLDKKIITAIKQFPERTRFMKGIYGWVGYKKIGVPFHVNKRLGGKSSWGFGRLAELAITGIISFSDVPLRVWGLVGFAISSLAIIYAIYIVTVTLLYGADMPGFPSIIVAVMFLGGIQLLSIGILGEYIARIFTEVKQRPKYLIRIKEGFND